MAFLSWIKCFFNSQDFEKNNDESLSKTVGDLQKSPRSEWGNQDIIKGLKFSATLQLRTPLRVLEHHAEVFNENGTPPFYALEAWEGVWVPVTKTFRELGVPIDEPPEGEMASTVGPVSCDGGNFLKFLIKVRSIVEQNFPMNTRRNELLVELRKDKWNEFVQKLGGIEKVANYFFPCFIELLPGLPKETITLFRSGNLITPSKILAIPDKEMLRIKGVGPGKLKKIREICSDAGDLNSEFVDKVTK